MDGGKEKEDVLRFQAMTPEQRLLAAVRLYESARQLKADFLRGQHPDWTDDQILNAVREAFRSARD